MTADQDAQAQLVLKRYRDVRSRIADLCRQAGRPADAVSLLCVSKAHPAWKVRTLYDAGHRDFGENYVDELALKEAELRKDCPELRWHFIGTLQSNKIQRLCRLVSAVHTVASEKHIRYLGQYAREESQEIGAPPQSRPLSCYLEINIGGESSKSGLTPDEAAPLAAKFSLYPNLILRGVMAIPPPHAPQEMYLGLAQVAASIGQGRISLGMSDDCDKAIAAGSTMVRVGTGIFGERPQPQS